MSSHTIIVGVDYGTTFTGVSYVFTARKSEKRPEILQIKDWPGPSKHKSETEKTPSRIAYARENRDLIENNKWGYQVTPHLTSYCWTKLLLDNTKATLQCDPGIARIATSEGAGFLGLPSGYDAELVCRDFLTEIYKYMLHQISLRLSRETVAMTPFEFWFTVPAIWSDAAKAATRNAACEAGFGSRRGDEIYMVPEPEAAAIATIKYLAEDDNVQPGDGILVCDCGGGTVDITTYTIISIQPMLDLEELLVGTGGKCGSTYIDRLFLDWMSEKFGAAFDDLPAKKKGPGSKFMQDFERQKFEFGHAEDTQFEVSLHMPKAKNSKHYDAEESTVTFDHSEMRKLFDPAIEMIMELLKQQIYEATKEGHIINVMILVGGFGNSRYLNNRLRAWCDDLGDIRLLCPENPQGAIVRGAALRGLEGNEVRRKRSRRHYGFPLSFPFREGIDPECDAYLYGWSNEKLCAHRIHWAVSKGQFIDEEFFVVKPVEFIIKGEFKDDLRREVQMFESILDDAPERSYQTGVTSVATFVADFSRVDFWKFPSKIIQGVQKFKIDMDFHIFLASKAGVLRFKAVCQGMELGKAEIQYKQ